MYDYSEMDEQRDVARDELWTPDEVAERWKIHKRTVLEMLSRGELNGIKIRSSWRVYLSEVIRYESRVPDGSKCRGNFVSAMPRPVVARIV